MKYTYTIVFLLFYFIISAQVSGEFKDIKSTTLSGSGDRNIVADQHGVLKIASGIPLNPANGEMIYFDGTTWQIVPIGSQGQILQLCHNVPTWGPCPTLFISAHNAEQITNTSAKIRWTTSENVQGFIEYGLTTSYGQQTTEELSFNYATHAQPLTGLQAGTRYYYRVHSTTESGLEVTATGSFMTTGGAPSDSLVSGDFDGHIKSTSLAGSGDRPVIADQNGILKVGPRILPSNPTAGQMLYYDGNIWQAIPIGTEGQTLNFCHGTPMWGPCTAVVISAHEAEQITDTSAKIRWTTSTNVQGFVEYGLTTSYGQQTSGETSFNYATHLQPLTGLQPGTTYYYRVHSITQAGDEITASGSFTTTGNSNLTECNDGIDNDGDGQIDLNDSDCNNADDNSESTPPAAGDWPSSVAGYNEDLPMAGLFYGATKGGLQAGNSPLGLDNSIRFRATRTGYIDSIRYNNRILTDGQMQERCDDPVKGGTSQQKYCDCITAGLTASQCAFTLSNTYHVGTGGDITIQIRPDDGQARHWPTNTILGKTFTYKPAVFGGNKPTTYPKLALDNHVYVEAGQIYHMVFDNTDGTDCDYRGLSIEEARNCTGGAFSINGMHHAVVGESVGGDAGYFGPYLGDFNGVLRRNNKNDGWTQARNNVPFYEIHFTDGVWTGESTAGSGNWAVGGVTHGTQAIDGDLSGRQVFTVKDASRTIDGLWVQIGHLTGGISGEHMNVKVKTQDGTVIATGSLPPSPECAQITTEGHALYAQNGGNAGKQEKQCKAWSYTDLSQVVTLQEGQTYMVEFSAPLGAKFSLASHYALTYYPYFSEAITLWHDSYAQYKRGANAGWQFWSGGVHRNRDIPMMFTILGMPKSLE